jgi:thiamine biosynthesis protein ThiI
LQEIPGIKNIQLCLKTPRDISILTQEVSSYYQSNEFKGKTIKVNCRRIDKNYPSTSTLFASTFAKILIPLINHMEFVIEDSDIDLRIEIQQDYFIAILNTFPGLGGFPSNSSTKGLSLLSGGIDSPVASFLALKKGIDLELIHFESTPLSPIESLDKVIDIAKVLAKYTYSGQIKLHIIPFRNIHKAILETCDDSYIITLLRYLMYQFTQLFANKYNIPCLFNGDSLGQVASQTVESMETITKDIKLQVFRPLICLDKEDIIAISKKIKTFDISIRSFQDCCTVYVPQNPVIRPKSEFLNNNYLKFDYQTLLQEALNNVFSINISEDSTFKPSELGLDTVEMRTNYELKNNIKN